MKTYEVRKYPSGMVSVRERGVTFPSPDEGWEWMAEVEGPSPGNAIDRALAGLRPNGREVDHGE